MAPSDKRPPLPGGVVISSAIQQIGAEPTERPSGRIPLTADAPVTSGSEAPTPTRTGLRIRSTPRR